MRRLTLAFALPLALAACGTTREFTNTAAPVAVVTDAQTTLSSYQATLGVAQVALVNAPAWQSKLGALAARAAPYMAAVQQGMADVSARPTLGGLAAQLLGQAAAYILATPPAP